MALKDYSSSIKDLQVENLQEPEDATTVVAPIQQGEISVVSRSHDDRVPDFQELAKQILHRRSYINSRSAYPICEEYLNHLKAIAKIADIPISNVINNIFALFFDESGLLTPTNASIKTMLNQEGHATLKDYLGSMRSPSKKP